MCEVLKNSSSLGEPMSMNTRMRQRKGAGRKEKLPSKMGSVLYHIDSALALQVIQFLKKQWCMNCMWHSDESFNGDIGRMQYLCFPWNQDPLPSPMTRFIGLSPPI